MHFKGITTQELLSCSSGALDHISLSSFSSFSCHETEDYVKGLKHHHHLLDESHTFHKCVCEGDW